MQTFLAHLRHVSVYRIQASIPMFPGTHELYRERPKDIIARNGMKLLIVEGSI